MLNNTAKLLAFCALFFQSIDAKPIKMEITLSGPNDDHCGKYTTRGNDFLVITHARIFQSRNPDISSGEMQIHGNIECHGTQTSTTKYNFDCDGIIIKDYEGINLMFSVTTRKQMLSGPIDYRYTESSMQLIKNGYLNPVKINKQTFQHDQHLHIQMVNITGLAQDDPEYVLRIFLINLKHFF